MPKKPNVTVGAAVSGMKPASGGNVVSAGPSAKAVKGQTAGKSEKGNPIGNLGDYAHPPKKKGRGK